MRTLSLYSGRGQGEGRDARTLTTQRYSGQHGPPLTPTRDSSVLPAYRERESDLCSNTIQRAIMIRLLISLSLICASTTLHAEQGKKFSDLSKAEQDQIRQMCQAPSLMLTDPFAS